MKLLFFLLFVFTLSLTGCMTTLQDPAKTAQKEAEQAEQRVWFEKAIKALEDREFVLEAERIDFKRGRFAYVTPQTNFISVDGNRATIQLAFNSPYAGQNGLGGVTVEGNTSNVKITTDKKGTTVYSMMVHGIGVSAQVTIRMYQGSNQCTALVIPHFSSNRISFTGHLYPKSESNIFKGRSL